MMNNYPTYTSSPSSENIRNGSSRSISKSVIWLSDRLNALAGGVLGDVVQDMAWGVGGQGGSWWEVLPASNATDLSS